MSRHATVTRTTGETDVALTLDVDGTGSSTIATGVGFFDHMLTLFARHGLYDLDVQATGDLDTGSHHTVEDTGIVLGQAFDQALGDRAGIERYGSAYVPMDECLAHAAVDISGRPHVTCTVPLATTVVGGFESDLLEEFMRAFANNARLTLHLRLLAGENPHHVIEACFKAVARAMRVATARNPREHGIPSTKGSL